MSDDYKLYTEDEMTEFARNAVKDALDKYTKGIDERLDGLTEETRKANEHHWTKEEIMRVRDHRKRQELISEHLDLWADNIHGKRK